MKRYLVSSLALSAFSIVGAVTAAEVALFDREFPLPAGCVLFPAPALVDGYIRIQCEQDLESPTLYLAFLKAEECETREELAPLIQRRVLSQQTTGNLKIVAPYNTNLRQIDVFTSIKHRCSNGSIFCRAGVVGVKPNKWFQSTKVSLRENFAPEPRRWAS